MDFFILKLFLLFSMQLSVSSREYPTAKVRTLEEAKGAEFFSLDFEGLAQMRNHTAETHYVTTEDDYILTIHRVLPSSARRRKSTRKHVAFLQHGLLASSDQFCGFGADRSIGYLLADLGYDVWLGNIRGNVYSRRHKRLSPEESKFWNFSIDDLALKDVPTMIDYVLETTGQSSLTYVGHSMGGTVLLMLLSERKEYNQKINVAVLLAPAFYWMNDNPTRLLAQQLVHLLQNIYPDGTTEILPLNFQVFKFFKGNCLGNQMMLDLCIAAFDLVAGYSHQQISVETWKDVFQYFPAGASIKLFYHYLQMYESGKFQHYDYKDPTYHLEHYGQVLPLEYNVTNIVTPMAIFLAEHDPLTNMDEMKELINRLPGNTTVIVKVIRKLNHIGFACAKDVNKLFYGSLVEVLRKYH